MLLHSPLCCAQVEPLPPLTLLPSAALAPGAAFLMFELSTPFINARWMLLKLGMAGSRLLALNNLVGFLVFFLCRNCYGPRE